ncbi:hypothetical protein GSI_08581 [Ganoderma sinense ZZ0214-1]|uniref:Uncharacterized protein n=1 Tax=Ganoderma sinense ZZ0214-1 TaxID=1077348 RepID=A0A2G8S444_9APHY|nr:hypothetical protein GSI_08581 [Ganoderma sinense ZZ0214-1]
MFLSLEALPAIRRASVCRQTSTCTLSVVITPKWPTIDKFHWFTNDGGVVHIHTYSHLLALHKAAGGHGTAFSTYSTSVQPGFTSTTIYINSEESQSAKLG